MVPFSIDLRERILAALTEESSSLRVAARFGVSGSVVRKLRLQQQRTGSVAPKPLPGRARCISGETEEELLKLVAKHPDATLNDHRRRLAEVTGVLVSETTMWRQLGRMGLTIKKKSSARSSGCAPTSSRRG